jgi:hypothetical protein
MTSTTVKAVEILTTLEEDPNVSFYPWEMDIHDIAAGMAKSLHANGLLSAVHTDDQWAAYPGNTAVDANGQVQIAARFTPPVYVDIHDGMTNIELYVAKAANDRLQLWIDSLESLKRAVIKSLGRVVRQIVRDPRIRFQRLSVQDIIARARARYGRMQKDTKQNLKERMTAVLQTSDGLDTHISNLTEMFDVSATAGFPVTETDKLEIFRDTVSGHPIIVKVFETFDFEFPDSRLTTYEQLAAYLVLHLPNLRHAQMAATRATANLVAATAYSTLAAKAQRLTAEVDKLKRKRTHEQNKGKGKGKTKKNEQKNRGQGNNERQQRGQDTEDIADLKYCHGHGYQKSHTSAECKLLASDKSKFTAEMRKAKSPHKPPGGSQKVNGQVASGKPKVVTANIAHQVQPTTVTFEDMDDNRSEHSDSAYDETAAFLAGILNETEQNPHEYATETATAMMMEDTVLLEDQTSGSSRSVLPPSEVPRLPLDENRGNQIHVRGEDKTVCPEGESNLGVRRFHEVPRLNLDENLGNQIHVEEADKLARPPTSLLSQAHSPSYPTQAKEAAPFGVARSSTSWTSLSHDKTVDNLSARKGLGRGGSEVVDEGEEDSHQHVLITDGSQFGLPFWEAELDWLQEQFRRQFVGMRMRDIPSRRIPTADELQIQYVTWLLERPTFPLLLEPASSGFYEDVYGCSMPPRLMPTVPQPTSGTGFFDEEYIAGTRRLNRDTLSTTVNPAQRGPTSYQDVFTAQLTTLSEVHRHEKRIYQPGYTPQEIRDNIKTSLRELKPDQHLVDFQDKDIPPSHRDPQTNRVLAGLLRQRDSLDRDFQLPPNLWQRMARH